jgi:aryl-alcohol dehydrogenase-like predicted oxidoreductase
LTNRKNMALIDACKKLKVIPLIRNPLGDGGLASGRYTATNPSGGETGGRSKFSFKLLDKLSPLHSVQEAVAERASARVKREQKEVKGRSKNRFPPPEVNAKITTTQVAINYVIAKGGVPLVDVYNTKTVEEVKGCLGWALTAEEVDMLDRAADLCGL